MYVLVFYICIFREICWYGNVVGMVQYRTEEKKKVLAGRGSAIMKNSCEEGGSLSDRHTRPASCFTRQHNEIKAKEEDIINLRREQLEKHRRSHRSSAAHKEKITESERRGDDVHR